MKLIIAAEPVRCLLRWGQRALVVFGVAMFAYCGYVWIDSWSFQRAERIRFESLLVHRTASPYTGGEARQMPGAASPTPPPASGGLLGRIDIPRLDLSVIVIEGTGKTTLRRAVGHIAGTALPGQRGNVGISGHRDTFFRPLRNIRKDDVITVTTLDGRYSYRVVSTSIVNPSDVAVLAPDRNEILTLVTCYPFYFVGAAPNRFIVRAERII